MRRIGSLDELVASPTARQFRIASQKDAATEDFDLTADLYDIVDDYYVIRPVVRLKSEGSVIRALLNQEADFELELSGGPGHVERDPLNGNLLVSTSSLETISGTAQASVEFNGVRMSMPAPQLELGIDPSTIRASERAISVSGGGACPNRFEIGMTIESEVQVRASIMAKAVPRSLERREVLWRHGRYFAYNPFLGFMSLSYDADRQSVTRMQTSNRSFAPGGDFFPAHTVNSLYFICDFVDLGIKAFSKEPMLQTIKEADWPPFSLTPIGIDKELDFFDINDPDRLIMRITGQNLYLYDYHSIEIELLEHRISDGLLYSKWRIVNQSDSAIHGRWFLLGDFVPDGRFTYEANVLMQASGAPDNSIVVEVTVPVEKSILRQTVSMNMVSLRDPILAGQNQLTFNHS